MRTGPGRRKRFVSRSWQKSKRFPLPAGVAGRAGTSGRAAMLYEPGFVPGFFAPRGKRFVPLAFLSLALKTDTGRRKRFLLPSLFPAKRFDWLGRQSEALRPGNNPANGRTTSAQEEALRSAGSDRREALQPENRLLAKRFAQEKREKGERFGLEQLAGPERFAVTRPPS